MRPSRGHEHPRNTRARSITRLAKMSFDQVLDYTAAAPVVFVFRRNDTPKMTVINSIKTCDELQWVPRFKRKCRTCRGFGGYEMTPRSGPRLDVFVFIALSTLVAATGSSYQGTCRPMHPP